MRLLHYKIMSINSDSLTYLIIGYTISERSRGSVPAVFKKEKASETKEEGKGLTEDDVNIIFEV